MRFLLSLFLGSVLALSVGALPARAQTWVEGPPLQSARGMAAAAVLDGSLYVIGGQNTAGAPLGSVERLNAEGSAWSSVDGLRDERYAAAAVAYNGRIVLSGGREGGGNVTEDVEEYVPNEDDWESFQSLDSAREGHGAVVLEGGIYVLGGAAGNGSLLPTCEYYDASDDDWYVYPQWNLSPSRASFGITEEGDAAYLAGGFGLSGPLDLLQRYTLNAGTTTLAPMPTARGSLALVSTGDFLFAIGGRTAADEVVGTVERYDIAQDTWSTVASLNTPREGAVAAYVDGRIVVAGGLDEYGFALNSVEVLMAAVDAEDEAAPQAFGLEAAYPNPFAEQTRLTVRADEAGPVRVAIYDVHGREVTVLLDRPVTAGTHEVTWDGRTSDGRPLASGVYLARLVSRAGTSTSPLTLLR